MVKVKDLFTYVYGINLELCNCDIANNAGSVPFVSRTTKNNGISEYVSEIDNQVKNKKHTLSVALGGSVLETFYQDREYYSGRDIGILTPKKPMTKQEMIYYAMCIRKNAIKYSYGRQANKTLGEIELPNTLPEWVNIHKIQTVEYTPVKKQTEFNQYIDIKLSELFDISRGKLSSYVEIKKPNGNIPIVGASIFDNGIVGYTNMTANVLTPGLSITMVCSDIGVAFYQEKPFVATTNIGVLLPKTKNIFTKYTALYIATLLQQDGKIKYSYGRVLSLKALNNTVISLPAKKDKITIDWETIETYMKNIEAKYKIIN